MDIASATNLGDIVRLLADTVTEEHESGLRLQETLLRAFQVESKMLALNAARSQLEVVQEDSKELLQTITAVAAVAESVSSKVREIDLSRTRLQQVAERVEKVASSKQAAEELEMALDNQQYEQASAIVRRFLGAVGPPHLVEGIAAFEAAVEEKLRDAEALGSVEEIGRFARVGATLGPAAAASGIARFAKHLRGVIAKAAKTHRERLADAEAKGAHAHLGCFSAILQVVGGVASEQTPVVLEHFGAEGLLVLLNELQLECDAQACSVIRGFAEKREISRLCRLASSASAGGLSAGRRGQPPPATPGLDPQDVNHLLDELAMISERATSYEAYMAEQGAKAEEALEKEQKEQEEPEERDNAEGAAAAGGADGAGADGKSKSQRRAAVAARKGKGKSGGRSGLREAVQECIGQYIPLEAYLVLHNIQQAVASDELPQISPEELAEAAARASSGAVNNAGHVVMPASTVVDEVFYVLQSALRRALAFANEDAVSAVINHVMSVVECDYCGYLQQQLEYHRETTLSAVGDTLGANLGSFTDTLGIGMKSFSMKGLAQKSPARGSSSGGGGGSNVSVPAGPCVASGRCNKGCRSVAEHMAGGPAMAAGGGGGADASSSSSAGSSAVVAEERACAIPPYAIYLNNVQLSIDYVNKLAISIHEALQRQAELTSSSRSSSSGGAVRGRGNKWEAALQEMGAALSLYQLQDSALSTLFDKLYPKLKAAADSFKEMNYVADDSQYSSWSVDDPWASTFVTDMRNVITPLAGQLTPMNYDRVVLLSAQTVAERMVRQIFELHSFTAEGALQLEKDVRTVLLGFTELTPDRIPTHKGDGVRASLGRLSNIAAIVTISSCEDLQDYDLLLPPTESSVNARRLSQPEAARLLKKRVDFPKAELAKLSAM